MPTIDAMAHAGVFGEVGSYGYQDSGAKIARKGISILNNNGDLAEEAKIILELAMNAKIILGTAHLSKKEIFIC